MRVLAEIRWCETHGKTTIVADDPAFCVWGESIWESPLCVVVDAQVTRKDDESASCDECGKPRTETMRSGNRYTTYLCKRHIGQSRANREDA